MRVKNSVIDWTIKVCFQQLPNYRLYVLGHNSVELQAFPIVYDDRIVSNNLTQLDTLNHAFCS